MATNDPQLNELIPPMLYTVDHLSDAQLEAAFAIVNANAWAPSASPRTRLLVTILRTACAYRSDCFAGDTDNQYLSRAALVDMTEVLHRSFSARN